MEKFEMVPIGHVRGGRTSLEDDAWAAVTARIDLDVVDSTAVSGLDALFAPRRAVSERSWATELMRSYW